MNQETMMEQIRRLNVEEQVNHQLKKQAAINKIRELRRAQRQQEELNDKEKLCQTDYS